jgi:pyocin large subunit-like protein
LFNSCFKEEKTKKKLYFSVKSKKNKLYRKNLMFQLEKQRMIEEKKNYIDDTKNIVEKNENRLLSIQNGFNRNLERLKDELKNIRQGNFLAKKSQKEVKNKKRPHKKNLF